MFAYKISARACFSVRLCISPLTHITCATCQRHEQSVPSCKTAILKAYFDPPNPAEIARRFLVSDIPRFQRRHQQPARIAGMTEIIEIELSELPRHESSRCAYSPCFVPNKAQYLRGIVATMIRHFEEVGTFERLVLTYTRGFFFLNFCFSV